MISIIFKLLAQPKNKQNNKYSNYLDQNNC